MKNDNTKDDLFFSSVGEQLNDYASPVDFATEWNGIQSKLETDKRRRKLLWWVLMLAALFLASGAYWLTTTMDSPETQETKPPIAQKSTVTISPLAKEDSAPSISPIKSNIVPNREYVSKSVPARSKEKGIAFPVQCVQDGIPAGRADLSQPHEQLSIQRLPSKEVSVPQTIPQLSNMPIVVDHKWEMPEIQQLKPKKSKASDRKFELYLRGGLSLAQQGLKAQSEADVPYANLRSEREQALETYSYEVGLSRRVGERSFLNLGLHYHISFDRLQHQHDLPKAYEFENILLRRITDQPTNEVQEVYGDTTVIGTQTITATHYNQYEFLDIGLDFGHRLWDTERISVSLLGGVTYGISLKANGQTLDPTNLTGPLVPLTGYGNTQRLGLRGGLSIDYKLGNRLSLSLQPMAGATLNADLEGVQALKANFSRYGITAGVKYRW